MISHLFTEDSIVAESVTHFPNGTVERVLYQSIKPSVPTAWFFCGRYGSQYPLVSLRNRFLFCNFSPNSSIMPPFDKFEFKAAIPEMSTGDYVTYEKGLNRILGLSVVHRGYGWVWVYKVRKSAGLNSDFDACI